MINGLVNYTFTIPELLSGTYYIQYTFNNYSSTYPFNLDGYSARITEIILDKEEYTAGEEVHLTLTVEANRNFTALIRTALYDQFLKLAGQASNVISLVEGENTLTITQPIIAGGVGIYAINPRIYIDLADDSL